MNTTESAEGPRPRSLTRVLVWTGLGLAGLTVLCAITAVAITPIANRAPTDDAPIVAADLMLVALAALTLMASAAVFTVLLLGTALVRLWRHWRPDRGEQPEPPLPPLGSQAGPAENSGPALGRDQDVTKRASGQRVAG